MNSSVLPPSRAPVSAAPRGLSRRDALRFLGFAGTAALFSSTLGRAAEAVAAAGAKPALPSLAGAQPGFYRFKVGAFEALALTDGGFAVPAAQSPFGVGEKPEAITAALADGLLPTDQIRLPFNVLLVRTANELVLIDSGCGNAFGPAGGRLVANLAAAGVKPEQVTAVILTHTHGDHFGGLLDANHEPTFKNAKHFVGKKEHDFWTGASPDLSGLGMPDDAKAGFLAAAQGALGGLKGKWNFVAGGDKLLDGLEIVDTPGHTPGHLAVLFSSGNEQLLHFADVAHSHVLSFAHPEWRLAFDAQTDVAVATRRKTFDRAAADKLRLFGAHMPFPGLGRVRAKGNAYEYVIEPWVVA